MIIFAERGCVRSTSRRGSILEFACDCRSGVLRLISLTRNSAALRRKEPGGFMDICQGKRCAPPPEGDSTRVWQRHAWRTEVRAPKIEARRLRWLGRRGGCNRGILC
jgi:hypothetical protein